MTYSRAGKAERLSYDHKATDPKEMKRVQEADGVVIMKRLGGKLII
jgi:protein phosphatase PTC1